MKRVANLESEDFIFRAEKNRNGHRDISWLRGWVKEICKLAEVPVISTHGLRGTAASIAASAGTIGSILAQSLGHESQTTTFANYAKKESVNQGQVRAALRVLEGGQNQEFPSNNLLTSLDQETPVVVEAAN